MTAATAPHAVDELQLSDREPVRDAKAGAATAALVTTTALNKERPWTPPIHLPTSASS